jgi:hypothetical protein
MHAIGGIPDRGGLVHRPPTRTRTIAPLRFSALTARVSAGESRGELQGYAGEGDVCDSAR